MRGRETRQSVPLGRVELLFDNGEVEQTWDVGLGSWSVGSSPQCGISIAGDSSIAARHLELTVGRRYTLLKAGDPIRVAGRIVREWLIDRTTVVECGNRKLRIYPIGFSASDLAQVSVVTQERIPEVASKLATVASTMSPTAVSESTAPADSETAMSSDWKRQLEEMRIALEEMQARVSAVSDPDALEHRIQSLANRSLSALEENLSQQVRQPLREEIAGLIQQERSRWESELQQRLDSIEVQLRKTSSQVDESLRVAKQDIGEINQRFQEFVVDRESANRVSHEQQSPRDQLSPLPERSRSTGSSSSELRREDATFMQRANPLESSYAEQLNSQQERDCTASAVDSDSEEQSFFPYGPSHSETTEQDQESNQAGDSDSDEVLEFQVDDESISLRLNRMLGERAERRSAAEGPKAERVASLKDDSAEVSERSSSYGPDVDGSTALSGRHLVELKHLHDSDIDERALSTAPKESIGPGSGGSFAKGTHSADSDPSDRSTDEASIEEYMQRLLERVRSGPSGNSATAIPSELPKNSVPTPKVGQRNAAASVSSATGMRAGNRVAGSGRTATKPVPEVKSDIQALRELANSNARRAINRSTSRRSGSRGLAKSMMAGISLLSGIALLMMDVENASIKFGGIAVSLIIALVWGFDTCRDLYSMLLNKDKEEHDEPSEETTAAKRPGNASKPVAETN